MHRVTCALIACLLTFLLAGCDLSGSGKAPETTTETVDPQILQDVIEAAYMVPGAGIQRAMRVNNFLRGVGLGECVG